MPLFLEWLDDYVSEDNPLLVISTFVDSLDMVPQGFIPTKCKETDPNTHFQICSNPMYGALNQLNSTRRLENEGHRYIGAG